MADKDTSTRALAQKYLNEYCDCASARTTKRLFSEDQVAGHRTFEESDFPYSSFLDLLKVNAMCRLSIFWGGTCGHDFRAFDHPEQKCACRRVLEKFFNLFTRQKCLFP